MLQIQISQKWLGEGEENCYKALSAQLNGGRESGSNIMHIKSKEV